MTDVVGPELHHEALVGEARRHCHDTRVSDEEVETRRFEVVEDCATDGIARSGEIAPDESDLANWSLSF